MRHLIAAFAGVAVLCSSMPAAGREPVRLKPASNWVLDYAEDSCQLARTFGEAGQQVTLVLTQFAPGDDFLVTLIGDTLLPPGDHRPTKVSLRFGPHEEEIETEAITGTAGTKRVLLFGHHRIAPFSKTELETRRKLYESGARVPEPPPIGAAREAAVEWLALSGSIRKHLVLETGPMDKTLSMLRECSWDTVKQWGLDVEQQQNLSRKPFPAKSAANWFNSRDYPTSMLRSGQQGIVHFRLLLDATGTPTLCNIQFSTRPKEFDDVVCKVIMKKARFEPALDAQGRPVPSYWRQTVNFRMQ